MIHIHDSLLFLEPYVRTLCGKVIKLHPAATNAKSWVNNHLATCPDCVKERDFIEQGKSIQVPIGHRQYLLRAPITETQTFIIRENDSLNSYAKGNQFTGTLKQAQAHALKTRVYANTTLSIYQANGKAVSHNTCGRVWW